MAVDPAIALVTVDEARAHLRLGDTALTADETSRLERAVNDASTWFAGKAGRALVSHSGVERHDGRGGDVLYLAGGPPVTAVASVVVDGVTIPAALSETADGWELLCAETEPQILLRGYVFTKGRRNVVVTRTAGWTADAVPEDLKGAVLQLIALRWNEDARNGAVSAAMAGGSASFGGSPIFANISGVAASYRRQWL
jgi:hypothetical protein